MDLETSRFGRLGSVLLSSTAMLWPAWAGRRWGPHRMAAGVWYRILRKPAIQPPDVVFPVVWSGIDLALTAAAYRLLRQPASPKRNRAVAWLAVNVGLIGAWSGVFFGRRSLPASTALAAGMIGTGAAYVAAARRTDRIAAAAGVPYVAWVGFATVLTAAIWQRNR